MAEKLVSKLNIIEIEISATDSHYRVYVSSKDESLDKVIKTARDLLKDVK